MSTIQWLKDPDAAFSEARAKGKRVFLDFTAAPL